MSFLYKNGSQSKVRFFNEENDIASFKKEGKNRCIQIITSLVRFPFLLFQGFSPTLRYRYHEEDKDEERKKEIKIECFPYHRRLHILFECV